MVRALDFYPGRPGSMSLWSVECFIFLLFFFFFCFFFYFNLFLGSFYTETKQQRSVFPGTKIVPKSLLLNWTLSSVTPQNPQNQEFYQEKKVPFS